MIDLDRLKTKFAARYGSAPRIFRAPGRINLIGEYTDMNDGFVLPAAIDLATYVAVAPRKDRKIRAASLNFDNAVEFDLDDAAQPAENSWTRYIQGVALTLEEAGHKLCGADLLIDSDIPVGAGLSSSAALEISTGFALATLAGHTIDKMELARIGQTAEHKYGGVLSGLMDQFASAHGVAGHALLLDCRSLEWSAIDVSGARFIVCNTMTKHDLGDSEYNKRRSECEQAASFLGKTSLRDVTAEKFADRASEMPDIPMRRARHAISENQRVLDAIDALKNDDMRQFGKLINASHESLRDDFEVSSDELDLMVDLARRQKGVLGARMMGGGFGGCTINLVENGAEVEFIKTISAIYFESTGIRPDIYQFAPADGVCEIG